MPYAAAADLRRLLVDDTTFFVASLASVAPDGGVAIGSEYFAPCFNASLAARVDGAYEGDLLFLALPVSQNWRNVLEPNATASVLIGANPDPDVVDVRHSTHTAAGRMHWTPGRAEWRKGMPSKARAHLRGTMTPLSSEDSVPTLAQCFADHHPDATAWIPGSKLSPHYARWVRFHPEHIYYVGGFGDEHFIGVLPTEVYRSESPRLYVQS